MQLILTFSTFDTFPPSHKLMPFIIYTTKQSFYCKTFYSDGDKSDEKLEVKTADVPDATYMKTGTLYRWLDTWTIARGRDCLYMWSSAAALELSHGSNGWFRYILDLKLSTMYSSGSPEDGSDSTGMYCMSQSVSF